MLKVSERQQTAAVATRSSSPAVAQGLRVLHYPRDVRAKTAAQPHTVLLDNNGSDR